MLIYLWDLMKCQRIYYMQRCFTWWLKSWSADGAFYTSSIRWFTHTLILRFYTQRLPIAHTRSLGGSFYNSAKPWLMFTDTRMTFLVRIIQYSNEPRFPILRLQTGTWSQNICSQGPEETIWWNKALQYDLLGSLSVTYPSVSWFWLRKLGVVLYLLYIFTEQTVSFSFQMCF